MSSSKCVKSPETQSTTQDCSICAETTNKGSRKPVNCKNCEFFCCQTCFCRYLLETFGEPKCMSCKGVFDQEYVKLNTPKIFYDKKYRDHLAEIQYSLEKSLLPTTQAIAEQRKKVDKYKDLLSEVIKEEKELKKKLDNLQRQKTRITVLVNRLKTSTEVINPWEYDFANDDYDPRAITLAGDGGEGSSNGVVPKKTPKVSTIPCVVAKCRGFVSCHSWKCGMCETQICLDCHEVKKENHTCNEDIKASIAFLAKDVKPCPKCSVPIHRISGCLQMWCTQCFTPFDWKTGEIVTGTIHNPHYYNYIRNNNNGFIPRNQDDVPCGGAQIPSYTTIEYSRHREGLRLEFKNWADCHRLAMHIDRVELPNYAVAPLENNVELRVSFLLGKISESHFKSQLKVKHKRREKKTEIYQIYDMFKTTLGDTFQMIMSSEIEYSAAYERAHSLRAYVNEQFLKVREKYSCVVPRITEKWEIKSTGGTGVSSSTVDPDDLTDVV